MATQATSKSKVNKPRLFPFLRRSLILKKEPERIVLVLKVDRFKLQRFLVANTDLLWNMPEIS